MNGQLAFVIQPEADVRRRLSETLSKAGLKVLGADSESAALERIDDLSFLPPDVILAPLDAAAKDGDGLLSRLRENPATRNTPVVVLAEGGPEERRRALRLGLPHLVPPPYENEELLLSVQLALAQGRDENLLSGSLAQLSLPDLLQTVDTTRRSGTVKLRSRGRTATLWFRDGRVIDAELEGGARGKEAVFAVATWDEGNFEATFGPVAVPERIFESTSFLLLEAMRRRDEQRHQEQQPPHAALPDPPPPPPRALLASHRALTLLTVAASYAAGHLERSLLRRRFEHHLRRSAERHPLLSLFTVDATGGVALTADSEQLADIDVEGLVRGVAAWLRDLFAELENAMPGRFSLSKLRVLTEAVGDDLDRLGFYRALGLAAEDQEDTHDH